MVMLANVAAALVPAGALRDPVRGAVDTPRNRLPKRVCPLVRHLAGRLEQEQAGVGVGAVEAAALDVAA